jgi:hypothetical protein
MTELQRVPVGRPLPPSWLPTLGAATAIVLALVVVKPWGGASPSPATTTTPSAAAAPSTRQVGAQRADRDVYEPRLFGHREPDPAWELWPAGYVVEFGLAGPLPVDALEDPTASKEPARQASPSPKPAGRSPQPPRQTVPPGGPVVDLGAADHLIALGINTPSTVQVDDVVLWLYRGENCCLEVIPIVRLPTPWPSRHFVAIGIADPERPGEPTSWLIGEYRLDLLLGSGETRSIRLRVTEPLD